MKRLSALAQLIRMYADRDGITKTSDLVELTGYTDRAIRKARAELGCRNQSAEPAPECRNYSTERNPGAGTIVPQPEPECRENPPQININKPPEKLPNPISQCANTTAHTRADPWASLNPENLRAESQCYWTEDGRIEVAGAFRTELETVFPDVGLLSGLALVAVEASKTNGKPVKSGLGLMQHVRRKFALRQDDAAKNAAGKTKGNGMLATWQKMKSEQELVQ